MKKRKARVDMMTPKSKRIDQTILRGDRVRYSDRHLDDTEQFSKYDRGPEPPCHWGFHARGIVNRRGMGSRFVSVEWDDGRSAMVLAADLKRVPEDEDGDPDHRV